MIEPNPKPRILIVEDEFLIRMTLAETLVDEGFEVAEAETGSEALALLAEPETDFALLLTDIQLPGGMSGLSLARSAREHRPDLPVIYVTGRPNSMTGSVRSPHDVCIAKPYLPSEVAAIVHQLTRK